MSKVYVTTYEIIGEGVPVAEKYFAEIDAAREAQWAFVKSVGGIGMRPERNGGLRSVFFENETPSGWRRIGRQGSKVEATPHRSTKSGKALAQRIAELPQAPRAEALAPQFGYNPNELAIDGDKGVIYFPTAMQVAHPKPRTFLRLPRFEGDGFNPDESVLRALPESELMKAVEDHNAEAKRQREKEAA